MVGEFQQEMGSGNNNFFGVNDLYEGLGCIELKGVR